MTPDEMAAALRRQGYNVRGPGAASVSRAGKSGSLDGSLRTSRAAKVPSSAGQLVVRRAGASKGIRSATSPSAGIERFLAFANASDRAETEAFPDAEPRAFFSRAEFMRQIAAGSPATSEAAAAQTIKVARSIGLIPKAVATERLPPVSDPGARAVALARRAGVIR